MTSELLEKATEKSIQIKKMKESIAQLERIKDADKNGSPVSVECRDFAVYLSRDKVKDIILAMLEADLNDKLKELNKEFDNLK